MYTLKTMFNKFFVNIRKNGNKSVFKRCKTMSLALKNIE